MERVELAGTDRRAWGIMVALASAMLLASLGTSIANIALPTLAEAFSAPFGQVQGVVVAYLATLTVSVVIVGRLGDVHGLTRMLLVGLGVFAAASLLCGVAPTLWVLIAARALQGIGAAFLMTLSMALMRETAGEARVGRAMGLLGTVSALGTALGPVLGGVLIPLAGWRAVFLVQVPLAVAALVLTVALLPRGAGKGEPARLRLREVMDRRVAPNLLTNVLVAAVMMTTLVVGPFYLGIGLGLTEAVVGLVMAVGPVISIVSGVPSGRLVDGWGSRRVMAAGLVLLAAGAFLIAILPGLIGVAGYVLAIAVLTPGYQLFQAANNTAALADVPKDRRGTVSGLLGLSRNIGLIVGASVMGAVFALGAGTANVTLADPAAIGAGMRLAFLTAGGLMIAAFLVASGTLFGRVARA
ncbi:MFS transporter [Azospirillum sp. RWY-5-1]|uniref:MFS transporter n=2 Tax=Azospirillum oleiclasticum TaxID=2735135 RepID=A0ABX2TKH3_9PROT|nr:MFS transporter [Azospirillum oleiclasticum]NYZ23648.1 MFS transporter [Azospirillum oleiclasticum]